VENSRYKISCSKEKFNILRDDERFLGLLTLARFINALRYFQKSAIDANGTDLVSARSVLNSFCYGSSVLYEGFLLVEKLAKVFKDLDSFKSGFGALLRDHQVQSFRKTVLKRMRNKFGFHFDEDVVQESLKNFELPEYKFASGVGEASGEMCFVLADEIVLNYLLSPTMGESDESLKQRYKKILEDTIDIMGKFTDSAERLMGDLLTNMGFTVKIAK
jgi:hypothetical protein